MSTLLTGLNPKQAEAVRSSDGPVLILAGAGSGKTKTLIHRIAFLVQEKKIPAWKILAVTFTNKASREMQERYQRLLHHKPAKENAGNFALLGQRDLPVMGTFHSICSRILRQEASAFGYKPHFAIYDTSDSLSLIKEIMRQLQLDPKQVSPQGLLHHISKQKNNLIGPDEYAQTARGFIEEVAVKVYPEYQSRLQQHQAMDFDDLLMVTVRLFEKHPSILQKYQQRFQYIMIDEYQDTNHAQFRLVNLLAKAHQNLCVIGDDYQAIYRFRGADYRNILEFERHYPKTKTIYLEQNYRSTQIIVEAGNRIIAENREQKKKKLWTENPKGTKIEVMEVFDEREEGERILQKILGLEQPRTSLSSLNDGDVVYETTESTSVLDRILRAEGSSLRTFRQPGIDRTVLKKVEAGEIDLSAYAILYRTNAQSRALEEALLNYGIPYQIVGGVNFYDRKEIKDVLAYLRVLISPEDLVSLGRIINEPARAIGGKTWAELSALVSQTKKSAFDLAATADQFAFGPAARRALLGFAQLMKGLQLKKDELPVSKLIDRVLTATGYMDFLKTLGQDGEIRLENIKELKTVAKKYDHLIGDQGLTLFLEEIALVSDLDRMNDAASKVTLMTVHSAKGLEFPNVFIAGLEEGLFPHANSIFDPQDLEEERRLCYVAVTRAKERLVLSYASQRTLYGSTQINAPSRFLDVLDDSLVKASQPF